MFEVSLHRNGETFLDPRATARDVGVFRLHVRHPKIELILGDKKRRIDHAHAGRTKRDLLAAFFEQARPP